MEKIRRKRFSLQTIIIIIICILLALTTAGVVVFVYFNSINSINPTGELSYSNIMLGVNLETQTVSVDSPKTPGDTCATISVDVSKGFVQVVVGYQYEKGTQYYLLENGVYVYKGTTTTDDVMLGNENPNYYVLKRNDNITGIYFEIEISCLDESKYVPLRYLTIDNNTETCDKNYELYESSDNKIIFTYTESTNSMQGKEIYELGDLIFNDDTGNSQQNKQINLLYKVKAIQSSSVNYVYYREPDQNAGEIGKQLVISEMQLDEYLQDDELTKSERAEAIHNAIDYYTNLSN